MWTARASISRLYPDRLLTRAKSCSLPTKKMVSLSHTSFAFVSGFIVDLEQGGLKLGKNIARGSFDGLSGDQTPSGTVGLQIVGHHCDQTAEDFRENDEGYLE